MIMKWLLLILIPLFCAQALQSQSLEAYLSLDSRGGYSTNTYLHPFISEWDQNDKGVYSRLSPSAEIYWNRGRVTTNISGGYFFEPTYDNRQDWKGFYGSTRFNYRLSKQFFIEAQATGSRLSSIYDRTSFSFLPALSWSPSFFTRIRVRAGSSFREYRGLLSDDEDINQESDRFDIYGLEIERWTSLKWQVRGGFYGLINKNLVDNHSLSFVLSRIIKQSAGVKFDFSLNRYKNSFSVDGDGGFIPISGSVSDDEFQVVEDMDMLLRSGLSFSFPIKGGFTGNGTISHLLFMPDNADSRSDAELSLGIRYRFSVSNALQNSGSKVSPAWEKHNGNAVIVKIRYQGEGDLYLVGEFNNWERPGEPLSRQSQRSNRYAALMTLEPGIYEYKVLLVKNGEESWIKLTDDTMTVNDGFGGINGLIFID